MAVRLACSIQVLICLSIVQGASKTFARTLNMIPIRSLATFNILHFHTMPVPPIQYSLNNVLSFAVKLCCGSGCLLKDLSQTSGARCQGIFVDARNDKHG